MAAVLLLHPPGLVAGEPLRQAESRRESPAVDAPITVTINPEARVSATITGSLPRPAACGAAANFRIRIVNQGFVTARLEAELLGQVPPGASLTFHPAPLKGLPEETRNLQILLTHPGPTDLTIAFRAHNALPDLGDRDRVHFLVHCLAGR